MLDAQTHIIDEHSVHIINDDLALIGSEGQVSKQAKHGLSETNHRWARSVPEVRGRGDWEGKVERYVEISIVVVDELVLEGGGQPLNVVTIPHIVVIINVEPLGVSELNLNLVAGGEDVID